MSLKKPSIYRKVAAGLATVALGTAGAVALASPALAMPPTGPGPTGHGTITIDDSNAKLGGSIVLTGEGIHKDDLSTGEYLSCKLLKSPASATSDKSDANGWYQLNWTNPDGESRNNQPGYTNVPQTDGTPANDTVRIVKADKLDFTDADNVKFKVTLHLPSGIAPDAYYTQCLDGTHFAIGSDYYVTKGDPTVKVIEGNPEPGSEITIQVSNFATGERMAWDGVQGHHIENAGVYPDVEVKLGDKVIGTAAITRNNDGSTTGTIKYTIPKDATEGTMTLSASQGYRHASSDVKIKPLPKYTVSFDAGTGTPAPATEQVVEGNTATQPTAPSIAGKKFLGWVVDGDTSGNYYNFATIVTKDIKLVAAYRDLKDFTVTFDPNDGTSASTAVSVKEDSTLEDAANKAQVPTPTRAGYRFAGWLLNNAGYDLSSAVTGDLTLQAKWVEQVTVTFDAAEGSPVPEAKTFDKGGTVAEPTAPTKDGFRFAGWYAGDSKFDFTKTVNASVTLKAKWVEQEKVTFVGADGKALSTLYVDKDSKLTADQIPTAPAVAGKKFVAWTLNNAAVNPTDLTVTEAANLVASYRDLENYTVKFDTDGGSAVADQVIVEDSAADTATKPADPTKDGYRFAGWADANGKAYDFSTKVTGNVNLKATWIEQVTVTFNDQAGNKLSAVAIDKGATLAADQIAAAPAVEGKKFVAWQTAGTQTSYDLTAAVNASVTLVPSYRDLAEFTITFDTDGGSKVDSQTVKEDSKATKPADPTKAGFKFAGWYLGDKAYNFDDPVTGNLTLKAKWETVAGTPATLNPTAKADNKQVAKNGKELAKTGSYSALGGLAALTIVGIGAAIVIARRKRI